MPEVENIGFGSRLGSSCMGVVMGPVLFLAAFPLLFMNEGCAVHRAETLAAGKGAAIDVSADKVDEANNDHLVHVTGEATTSETLYDSAFGIAEKNAIKLSRTVEIYQWKETSDTKTRNKLGGGQEKVTSYKHNKEWVKAPVDSSNFKPDDDGKAKDDIRNIGTLTYQDSKERAKVVKLGAFTLADSQIERMGAGEKLPATKEMLAAITGDGKSNLKISGDGNFYIPYRKSDPPRRPADDPTNDDPLKPTQPRPDKNEDVDRGSDDPRIGDQRISFTVLKPETVSVLAMQKNGTFEAWPAPSGTGSIDEFKVGTHSKEAMFSAAESTNVVTTWILRFVGYALMAFGIFLVGQPIATFANILPFLGEFVTAGIAIIAAILALPLTLITIALGWIFYRPLLGFSLLAIGLCGIGAIIYFGSRVRAQIRERKMRNDGMTA